MDTTNTTVIIIDGRRFYTSAPNDSTGECIMCDYDIPFSNTCLKLKVIDEYEESSTFGCFEYKGGGEDLLNDQERFLKEREKRTFKKSIRKR